MKHKLALLIGILFGLPSASFATTYYINTSGNDANPGTSPAQAWRTPSRVHTARLQPGDRVLLAGGQSFDGSLLISSSSYGTTSQPLTFSSYGPGRATINSGESCGFYAYNRAAIEVRNLAFVGSGRLRNKNSGINFYLDSASTQLQHICLDSLNISGYRDSGILIGSWNGLSGYRDVRITNCQVHDNGAAGINSYSEYPLAQPGKAHHDWYIGNCVANDNPGRADVTDNNSGNGIVLAGIDGAMIERCIAYRNGWLNANLGGGPVGIWGWYCNNLTIQLCESHHNSSGTSKDGGGFDLDGGCTNSVMQYNYSHDNQGPGYLLAQFDGAPAMHDLTVRYNISENDAWGYSLGAIMLWSTGANGGIVRADIYNNTVFLGPTANGSMPSAFSIISDGIKDVAVRNNLLQTSPGQPVVSSVTASGIRLQGNCYWTSNAAAPHFEWTGATYNSLEAWRTATSQEVVSNTTGSRATGIVADPKLIIGSSTRATTLTSTSAAFNLGPNSVLAGAGLKLAAEFGIDPGQRDYFGNATPSPTTAGNIGASEAKSAVLASAPTAVAGPWCQVYPTIVTDQFNVVSSLVTNQEVEVQLLDMLGRSCQRWSRPGNQLRTGGLVLPTRGLAPGHYVLRVQVAGQLHRQSLLLSSE